MPLFSECSDMVLGSMGLLRNFGFGFPQGSSLFGQRIFNMQLICRTRQRRNAAESDGEGEGQLLPGGWCYNLAGAGAT